MLLNFLHKVIVVYSRYLYISIDFLEGQSESFYRCKSSCLWFMAVCNCFLGINNCARHHMVDLFVLLFIHQTWRDFDQVCSTSK